MNNAGIRMLLALVMALLAWTALALPEGDGRAVAPEAEGGSGGVVAPELALPLLDIAMDDGGLPGDDPAPGTLTCTEPDGLGGTRVVQSPVELRLRGNTSRRFPKLGYKLKLTDGAGDKRDLSLAGLRSDDDWILNPLYADTSKLREALSYWLWEQINSRGSAAAASRFAFVELRLNGEYWGLYGLQERTDRKQVGADKRRGILYKVDANDCPDPGTLAACDDPERCGGFQLEFAGAGVESPWLPAADYAALLAGGEGPGVARLSPENAADFALWSLLVQARDNHFKNQFIHCAPEGDGYVLYRIPWDLNHTLGDLWAGDSPETNYVEYEIDELAVDDALAALLAAGDGGVVGLMKQRWAALRAGSLTEENLLGHARALFDGLYPAILRDNARWPECGMGEGSAANIRDIEDYLRTMLPRLDAWVDGLETEGEVWQ